MKPGLLWILLAATLTAVSPGLQAEEGMWPMDSFDEALFTRMQKMGLELSQDEIFAPGGKGIAYAIVDLGGGTGSFISPQGLILTNHHVAFGALQRASSSDDNILENGFYSGGSGKDIPAQGYSASVLISIEDVTGEILEAAGKKKGADRFKAIEDKVKAIELEGEKGKDVRCEVAAFYGGLEFKLFTYFRIKDVRIVYAPPRSIGNYGGDIDNWMWPRHTGDFSILRAYVAPDGSSAEYSEDNVPYEPAVHLAISSRGVTDGDYTMIMGFPGATQRYRTSYSIEWSQNWRFPSRIRMFGDMLDIMDKAGEKDPGVKIKVAFMDAMLNNSMKNYEGQLEGFMKADLLDKKIADEKAFMEWVESDKKRKKKYGDILPSIEQLYREQVKFRDRDAISGISGFVCQMLGAASRIYKWSEEKEKKDIERKPGFMERDISKHRMRLNLVDRSYSEDVDRAILAYLFRMGMDLPEDQRSEGLHRLINAMPGDDTGEKIDAYVEKLFTTTRLADAGERLRMFDLSREELLKEGEPFIDLLAELEKETREDEKRTKEFEGNLSVLRPRLISALKEWKGGNFYPDANGTMRLTFGTVKGYSPADAIDYDYITSLSGVVAKHTGEEPFDCPERLLQLHEKRDPGDYVDSYLDDVPVAFLSTCDITGGNSGSPILNGRGEVIGAAFDGNWESVSADYLFNEKLNRCISVESRYILFILDRFSGARELLDELTIN